jgi:hypothetical protein
MQWLSPAPLPCSARQCHPGGRCRCNRAPPTHVPSFLDDHLAAERIALGDPHAELAALPYARKHLAQGGLHPQVQAEPVRQRGRRLGGTAQVRDVDRIDAFGREPRADPVGLLSAELRQGRVPLPLKQCERRAIDVCLGFTMPHQEESQCAGRGHKPASLPLPLVRPAAG